MQHDIFGGHAGAEFALDADFHRLGLLELQRLRGQNMFDLGRANAERPARPDPP